MSKEKFTGPADPLRIGMVLPSDCERLEGEHGCVGEADPPKIGLSESFPLGATPQLTRNRTTNRPDAVSDESSRSRRRSSACPRVRTGSGG